MRLAAFVFAAGCQLTICTAAAQPQEVASPELKHILAAPMNGSRSVSLSAQNIERGTTYPSVIHLRGNVEIKVPVCLPVGKDSALVCDGEMVVTADQAEFHEETGAINAHGNVNVTPLRQAK